VASLLFFLAPVFRQAFHVSLAQWHDVPHIRRPLDYQESDPELEGLARKADQNHDAEGGLAVAAMRHWNESESVRLQMKPFISTETDLDCTAVIAVQHSNAFRDGPLVSLSLSNGNSQNALPHFHRGRED